MAYPKRDWANTGNEVTKDDFKRIENGIEANDIEITKQKNPTIPGTLAKQIADNVTAIEENANKINVLSNPNLLINGDFQVWQRGTSFSTGKVIYTADRWMSHEVGCEKVSDGIKITGDGVLEYHIENLDKFIGKPLTLSYSMNGIIYTQTKILTKNPNYTTQILNFRSDSWTDSGRFTINNLSAPYIINWVKIELGNKATPFVPRPYAEELAMCQRYCEIVESIVIIGDKVDSTNKNICSSIPFKVEKRIIPTITYTSAANVSYVGFVDIKNLGVIDNNKQSLNPLVGIFLQGLSYSGIQPVIIRAIADAEIY